MRLPFLHSEDPDDESMPSLSKQVLSEHPDKNSPAFCHSQIPCPGYVSSEHQARPLNIYFPLFSSIAQSCLMLCESMDYSTPGFPVHHHLLKLAQTRVHQVGDAIQPSHPLSFPSLSAFNLSPASGSFPMSQLFASVAKVLEFQLQHQSFQWIFWTDFLYISTFHWESTIFHCTCLLYTSLVRTEA